MKSNYRGMKVRDSDNDKLKFVGHFDRDGYTISTDKERLDIGFIHDFLSNDSYWAQCRSLELVQRSIENSLNF